MIVKIRQYKKPRTMGYRACQLHFNDKHRLHKLFSDSAINVALQIVSMSAVRDIMKEARQ